MSSLIRDIRIRRALSGLMEGFLDVLFPPTCPMCGRVMRQHYHPELEVGAEVSNGGYNAPICASCYKNLPRTEEGKLRGNKTEELFDGRPRFVRGGAFLFFEKDHPVQRLVHAMKFHRQPEIGYYMGTLIAEEWLHYGFFDDIDVIIPVPLHKKRLRERGYNQSEYIAKGISDVTGLPIDNEHVARVRETHQQALQNKEGRTQNVAGAFELRSGEALKNKHVLLVDDLITTGSTVLATMDAFKDVYGLKYSVLSLGKAI